MALLERKRQNAAGSVAFLPLLRRGEEDEDEREQKLTALKPLERRTPPEEKQQVKEMRAQLMGDQELAREMTLNMAGNMELAKYTLQGGAASLQTNLWRMELVTWNAAELQWRTYYNYYNSRLMADEAARESAEEQSR